VEKYFRARQATEDNMAHAHCMLDTSEYAILHAFPQQQWMHERTLRLRYTYIGCLFMSCYMLRGE